MLCTSPNHCVKYKTMPPIDDSLYMALLRPQAAFMQCTANISQKLGCRFIMLCTFPTYCAESKTMPPIDDSLYAALISLQATFTQCTAHMLQKLKG